MPVESRRIRLSVGIVRSRNSPPIERIVDLPIRVIALDFRAHPKREIGVDRYQAEIVESMDIASHENAVPNFVRGSFGEGSDVCGLQDRKRPFLGDRTSTLVRIHDHESERTLTATRGDKPRSGSILRASATGRSALVAVPYDRARVIAPRCEPPRRFPCRIRRS